MEIIIVLGCVDAKIREKRVNRAIYEFKNDTKEYYCPYTDEYIIQKYILFSGGSVNKDEKENEADIMFNYTKQFIDEKFLDIENKSRNTVENLQNCKQKIDEIFENMDKPIITICTSTFHINRVIILSKLIFNDYKLRFIHTNEEVSRDHFKHEENILNQTLQWYCKQQLLIQ